jgi:hypothetical protein
MIGRGGSARLPVSRRVGGRSPRHLSLKSNPVPNPVLFLKSSSWKELCKTSRDVRGAVCQIDMSRHVALTPSCHHGGDARKKTGDTRHEIGPRRPGRRAGAQTGRRPLPPERGDLPSRVSCLYVRRGRKESPRAARVRGGRWDEMKGPGEDRLSRRRHYHGPGGLNGRVRDGNGWDPAGIGAGKAAGGRLRPRRSPWRWFGRLSHESVWEWPILSATGP